MQLKQLLNDDNGVSPVIGVILMVAITVILAAVIATFVLGLGEQVSNTAPQASFSFDYASGSPGELTVTHDGGDTIKASELYFRGQMNNAGIQVGDSWKEVDGATAGTSVTSGSIGGESAVAAGDYAIMEMGDDSQLRLVYEGANSDSSATLASWEGPNA